jgi:hypothetical protein
VRRILDQPLEKIRELSSNGLGESELALIAEMFGASETGEPAGESADDDDV